MRGSPITSRVDYAVAVTKENSARLIFAHKATRENILTAKITQTTVVTPHLYCKAITFKTLFCTAGVISVRGECNKCSRGNTWNKQPATDQSDYSISLKYGISMCMYSRSVTEEGEPSTNPLLMASNCLQTCKWLLESRTYLLRAGRLV